MPFRLFLLALLLSLSTAIFAQLDRASSFRDNGLRGEVSLNGTWEITEAGKAPATTPVPLNKRTKTASLYRREITLPAAWAGRRLTVEVQQLSGPLVVNGDTIAVANKDYYREYELPASATGKYVFEITGRSFFGDAWLRSYPRRGSIVDDTYMQTSFRKMEAKINLAGAAGARTRVQCKVEISEAPDGPVVKSFVGTATANADGRWQTALTEAWPDAKLWSLWHPNLYYYRVEITDGNGKVTDAVLPRRFGFREVWMEDGQFVVNGKPTTVVDDVWEGGAERNRNANRCQMERVIDNLKDMGITGGYRISSETSFDVADEKGFHFRTSLGSLVRFNIWNPKSGLTPMAGRETETEVVNKLRRLREHPSIIAWESPTAYALASMHPEYAGIYYPAWNHFPLNRLVDSSRAAQELFYHLKKNIVEPLDDTRIVGNHNGPYSDLEIATRYLTDFPDVQEREEFFDYWYRSGKNRKVIWTSEWGAPFAGHQQIRYIDHQMPQAKHPPKIHVENAARYFGPSVYARTADEDFAGWLTSNFTKQMRYPVMQELTALNAEAILRAWRTYGVNASGHHVLNENVYGQGTKDKVPFAERYAGCAVEDDGAPGHQAPAKGSFIPIPRLDGTPPAARAYLRGTRPVLGYIGGSDGRFTRKDRNYFSGEQVRKQFIIINDLDDPQPIDGSWALQTPDGATVVSGPLKATIRPGHRATTELPIEFAAPSVSTSTAYRIVVSGGDDSDDRIHLRDTFALTVFPAPASAPEEITFSGDIYYLNISDDLTHESPHFALNRDIKTFLASAGLTSARLPKGYNEFEYRNLSPVAALDLLKSREKVTEGLPGSDDLLIIPRGTLDAGQGERQKNIRFLERINLDSLVAAGLRVLIMEQNLGNIMGLETEETRPRRTFIAAAGHPVFAGLTDAELSYWRGNSDLTPAITPYSATENRFPERIWHFSHTNTVATAPCVRPQVGAARALAVSGFDLQEAPLLEVARGKGRMIFCQFDVTRRYGVDPAATRLVDNLLGYITSVDAPDPSLAEVAVAEEKQTQRTHLFRASVPAGRVGWGITPGELFFREAIYERATLRTTELPDVKLPVFANESSGQPAVIRFADGRYATTLTPELFESGWMKRKVSWLYTTMRLNQGGSSLDGPRMELHGDITALYPYEWVQGFVHPYTSDVW